LLPQANTPEVARSLRHASGHCAMVATRTPVRLLYESNRLLAAGLPGRPVPYGGQQGSLHIRVSGLAFYVRKFGSGGNCVTWNTTAFLCTAATIDHPIIVHLPHQLSLCQPDQDDPSHTTTLTVHPCGDTPHSRTQFARTCEPSTRRHNSTRRPLQLGHVFHQISRAHLSPTP
jgi:hypothetical protein